ncbi:xanthine dehydrogenase small subunit [Nakamurella panacisegetis]|uniref:Xanthine dehydrogenase small subunit n=1 Tax=Nakamurella panacisegetis TaxID=1090615 RepID=A0A1H0MR52_9ACTN|nr:xanthine dehydrogenase small subunit [Nakamurella panacisegetis]
MVNGRSRLLGEVGGHVTLLEWLRSAGYTGSKEGCAEGECGACAVLVARPDGESRSRWTAINACLVPAAGLDQQEIVTAEGLGRPTALHPVQAEMATRGGSQCGYCTPGFVCSMASEFYRADRRPTGRIEPAPSAEPNGGARRAVRDPGVESADDPAAPGSAPDHEHGPNGFDLHALSGNLCRCTGYRPIRDAAYALGAPADDDPLQVRLQRPAPEPAPTRISSGQGDFARPVTLSEALTLLADHPTARLVAGSTDWGVELNIRHARTELTIAIDRLAELRELNVSDDFIDIGAALSLSEVERGLAGRIPLLAELFPQFASRLIRNGATLGGNLGTGSPIGDSSPALLALDASLVLARADGERTVRLADYFTGYRESIKEPDELIRSIRIPRPLAPVTAFHKIAKRRFDDISSVAVAFALWLEPGEPGRQMVTDLKIGLGGVAAIPLRAFGTEAALIGKPWDAAAVAVAAEVLGGEGTPMGDHRASAPYRAATLRTSLLKFFAHHQSPNRTEVTA